MLRRIEKTSSINNEELVKSPI